MTPVLLTVLLGSGLLGSAVLGPWMLRRSAPALMRAPRLATLLLLGAVVIWMGTLLALGPLLAWVVSGPALLPEAAAAVCQQCLAAANPFSTATVDTAIPAVLLLAFPTAVAALLTVGFAREMVRRLRSSRRAAAQMLAGAVQRTVLGYQVSVIPDDRPFALTFPARSGGIVLSTGAVRTLGHTELAAVLAHERAHLRQHHHVVTALLSSIARHLRWVPLIAAVEDAVPHYLEIAADNQARHQVGTTALVSALLTLGDRTAPQHQDRSVHGVLHAAGPERIKHLVRPAAGRTGALPTLAVAAQVAMLGLVSLTVYLPYALAALSGCL